MRSLLLAPTLPSEAGNGLDMRIGMFLQALCRLGEVELIVLPFFGGTEATNALCQRLGVHPKIIPASERADTQFLILQGLADSQTRLDAFVRYGQPSLSAYLSVPVLQDIRNFVGDDRFDLVHLARSYLLPVISAWPQKKKPKISVDLDEDDVETHQRIARLNMLRGDGFAAEWLGAEAAAFDRLLLRWLPQTDVAFIATEREGEAIEGRYGIRPIIAKNAVMVPSGVARNPSQYALLFVGGFGYFPNLDAALWILEEILPALKDRLNSFVSMTMVGRNPPKQLLELADRIGAKLLDNVCDLSPIYARASIALVPLRAGGGSRIKLLEAAAHCVPIVATSTGAENSGLINGREISVADTPEAIAEACLTIWREPEEASRRTAAARRFVEAHNSRPTMISALTQHFAGHVSDPVMHQGELL